jgi:hypothetical protein
MIDYECNDCDYYHQCNLERIEANSRHNSPPCALKEWLKLQKQNATIVTTLKTVSGT